MTNWNQENLQKLILNILEPKLQYANMNISDIGHNDDLLAIGVVDSFDVVEVLTELEHKTGITADMEGETDDDFTVSVEWFSNVFLRAA